MPEIPADPRYTSDHTVAHHLRQAFRKLGIASRVEFHDGKSPRLIAACRSACRGAAVAHQDRHLVRRLRRQRPEVPLHVAVPQVGVGAPLLRVDEVLELLRVADEEDRRVVPDDVVIALPRVELERDAARCRRCRARLRRSRSGSAAGSCGPP
jgi:hypothetical protein